MICTTTTTSVTSIQVHLQPLTRQITSNDAISSYFKGVFSPEMYAEEAETVIASHNSSSPLFLMVAFQVSPLSPGLQSHHILNQPSNYPTPNLPSTNPQAPHNPFNEPPQRYSQPYRSLSTSSPGIIIKIFSSSTLPPSHPPSPSTSNTPLQSSHRAATITALDAAVGKVVAGLER